jgi:predicted amidophosphoribosyltransferase
MRNRHVSRLCRPCQAPMGRQEDTCWQCGSGWASEDGPRTTTRLIDREACAHAVTVPAPGPRSR